MKTSLRNLFNSCRECTLTEEGDDSQEVAQLRKRVRQAEIQNENTKEAEVCFSLGFCFYTLWCYSDAIRWFWLALGLDENHQEAHRYLGHSLFDQGNYLEAQPHLEVARKHSEQYQPWLQLKLEELVVCCRLHRSTDRLVLKEACGIIKKYRDAPQDEVALPTELVVCIAGLARTSSENRVSELFEKIQQILVGLDIAEAFSEELESITKNL